ncbi:MAG: DsbE family thiol:disulfide interchange protein [Gemmobacter sp.]
MAEEPAKKKVPLLVILPPALFGLLAGLFFFGMQRDDPDGLPSAIAGRQAPAVQVVPLGDGVLTTDAALRDGEVTLLNFWASWCAPCRVEHPQLQTLADEGMVVHGVNYKDNPSNALGFLHELGDPYTTMGADASGRMALDWGVYGVPETYVIDGDGTVILRFAGPVTVRVLDEMIRPAIEEARNR